jgi:hypothetical protein
MGNMSYCRFENTSNDMRDCENAINNGDLGDMSSYEIKGFVNFIKTCKRIAEQFEGMEDDEIKEYINGFQDEEEEDDDED